MREPVAIGELDPLLGGVDDATCRRIERFLSAEADLLDERRFDQWFDLLDEAATYTMETVVNGHQRVDRNRPEHTYLFCDNKAQLSQRIARLRTGIAWSEEPPSRTRRLIGNVIVEPGEAAGRYAVRSNFVVFRSRQESDNTIFIGGRQDVLAERGRGFAIFSRRITIDQATLQAHNLSIFF